MSTTLHCLALHDSDGSWWSICVELALYVRASSLPEAQERLSQAIRRSLPQHAEAEPGSGAANLLRRHRRSPLVWARRLACALLYRLLPATRAQRYRETVPWHGQGTGDGIDA